MSEPCNQVYEKDWYRAVKQLDETRDNWIKRSVVTLDFSDESNVGTYLERVTFDVNWQGVLETSEASVRDLEKPVYVPVGWRTKSAFLEFDCKSNNGTSLTLVPWRDRIEYVNWLFWNECCESGVCERSEVTISIRQRLKSKLLGQGEEYDSICFPLSVEEEEVWKSIQSDSRIRNMLDLIQEFEPLILLSTNKDDLSLLKIAERKTLKKWGRHNFLEAWRGAVQGSVECSAANSTKIIPPNDMRIKSAFGFCFDSSRSHLLGYTEAEIYGDESWAVSKNKLSGSRVSWLLEFTTRRSHFLEGGIQILTLALLAIMYWSLGGYSSDYGAIAGISLSFTVVGSYFLHGLLLFNQYGKRSLLFKWILKYRKKRLMRSMGLTLLFPYIGHVFRRVSSVVELAADWPIVGSVMRWLVEVLRSVPTYGVARFLLAVYICSTFAYFAAAHLYGRPAYRTRS